MTATQTVRQYGETVLAQYKTSLLATLGAGDLAVERTRELVGTLRGRAEALPGEAQVQADLAAKELRTRVTDAVSAAQHLVAELRREDVRSTVARLVEEAREQAEATLGQLSERGAEVVEELRRQPGVQRFLGRTEAAVDAVEDRVEDLLEETGDAVAEASNEVTSVAQKAAAKAGKAVDSAEDTAREAAGTAKRNVRAARAPKASADKSAPARKRAGRTTVTTPDGETTVLKAATAERQDPTEVPAKSDN
jgi:heparin binding hemagglutinin HbhA